MNERTERLLEILHESVQWCIENKQLDETHVPYWDVLLRELENENAQTNQLTD